MDLLLWSDHATDVHPAAVSLIVSRLESTQHLLIRTARTIFKAFDDGIAEKLVQPHLIEHQPLVQGRRAYAHIMIDIGLSLTAQYLA